MNTYQLHTVRMSLTHDISSALERFECGNMIEIRYRTINVLFLPGTATHVAQGFRLCHYTV